jgi:hypothetical protein
MKWFSTDGGPTLVLAASLIPKWRGIEAPVGRTVEAVFRAGDPSAPATDYDRACDAADDWLGCVKIDDGLGLVLGGDETSSAFYVLGSDFGIVRWIAADSEEAMERLMSGAGCSLALAYVEYVHPGGELVMMAACDDASGFTYEPLKAVLPAGRYRVHTLELQESGTEALLHRFELHEA